MDLMVWNVVFLVINFVHLFYLLYKRRPVSSASTSLTLYKIIAGRPRVLIRGAVELLANKYGFSSVSW